MGMILQPLENNNRVWAPPVDLKTPTASQFITSQPVNGIADTFQPGISSDPLLSGRWRYAPSILSSETPAMSGLLAPLPAESLPELTRPLPFEPQPLDFSGSILGKPLLADSSDFRTDLKLGKNPGSKTYYVTFSGMGDPNSGGGNAVKGQLKSRGVPDDQCIVATNFCSGFADPGADPTLFAGQLSQNLDQYDKAASPNSSESSLGEAELKSQLKQRGFDAKRGDRIVLIGHSLGGQRALSVAERMENNGAPADAVVTLGTPVSRNGCQRTPVTNVYSSDDPVIASTCNLRGINLSPGKARAVKVNNCGHHGYVGNSAIFGNIVDRALQDPTGQFHPSDSKSMLDVNGDNLQRGAEWLGGKVVEGVQSLIF